MICACQLLRCFILFLLIITCFGNFEEKVKRLTREDHEGCPMFETVGGESEDKYGRSSRIFLFIGYLFIGLLGLLLFLGLIKGILGLCCLPIVGMWGLGILIDLPRPLDYYQEDELRHLPVEYDDIGWPIHPETKERSVRALTKQTEFCLNIIFFITYPVIIILELLSMCCFQTYDHDNDKNQCFEGVNTVVFCNCTGRKKCYVGKTQAKRIPVSKTVYEDENDAVEEYDTNYVFNMLRHSQDSIRAMADSRI